MAAYGVDVTAPDLVAYFETVVANQAAMADAELEQIAGGRNTTLPVWVASLLSAGVGCAILSLSDAIDKKDGCMQYS